MDAGSRNHPSDGAPRVCRSCGHCWASGIQRGSRVFPGGTRTGYSCRAKIATCAYGFGAARRRLEEYTATELVPGDTVKLSLGGVVAADVKLVEGSILLDQSTLTGESVPIEAGPGLQTYAGALVRRGEAAAIVTATGARTKFGQTAELVRTAHVESTQQKTVVRVVRNLAMFNGVIILLLVAYAHIRKCRLARLSHSSSRLFWRRSR